MEKKQFLNKKNLIVSAVILLLALVVTIISIFATKTNKIEITSELAKAMTYDQVVEGEEATNSDYVKFDAFFLRDLDGDGYTESLRGTCKEIGTEDTLYMELKVVTNGYFENGVITLNSNNFYFDTKTPKDAQIKDNAIGANVSQITFNQISSGTQKLLTGFVKSGNYSYESQKYDALKNNPSNYSKVNSVTLTGTHVADDGTRTEISKTVEFDVDWYGSTNAELPEWIESETTKYYKNQTHNVSEIFDDENGEIRLDFEILTRESYNDLFLSKAEIQADIPTLNGYEPNDVMVVGTNVTYTYDPTTRLLIAQREAKLNDEGYVEENAFSLQSNGRRYNKFNVIVTYPLEAYDNLGADYFTLRIPVRAYNYGFNNTNEEFTNPYVSEVAKDTVVLNYCHPTGDVALFGVTVGKLGYYPQRRYFVSKEKPLNIYNDVTDEEIDDNYFVTWHATTGTAGESDGIVMKETKDNQPQVYDYFIKNDSTDESMENVVSNIGIALGNPEGILGEDGWVKVYDEETGDLLITFDKNNWNEYSKANTYKYELPVKNVRVETSATKASSYMYVYHEKQIDVDYVIENYTREEFDALSYIATTLEGYLGGSHINTASYQARYEDPMSVLRLYVSPYTFSTQATEKNVNINISPEVNESYNEVKWKDAIFLVKVPEEVVSLKINSVLSSNTDVEISAYELYEENNNKYIKIITSNEEPTSFSININVDLTPDPRGGSASKAFEVYAINDFCENYYFNEKDIYDIDGDENVEEKVAKYSYTVNFVAPSTLLTSQLVKNYDDIGSETIAPEVAIFTKQQRTATIEVGIKNNYTNTVSEIQILGKVPKVGNGYAISDGDLGSQFSVNMTSDGVKVPEELASYAKVYYSSNEEVTRDIKDTANGWTQEVSDWSEIKSYLIVLDGYVMDKDISHQFTYDIEVPGGVEYNQIACSHHGVYFCLDTEEGKYKTNTEPNKLGLLVAREFNLNLSKYQEDTEKLIPGATYSVTEQGTTDSKVKTTDSNGNLLIEKLYVERTYEIKEVRTPDQYELNEDVITFKVVENDDTSLSIVDASGETRNGLNLSVDENGNDVVSLEVEDRVKPNINIIKTVENTSEVLENIKFRLTGKGIVSKGKVLKTDANGNADAIGLYLDEEYVLQEVIANGFYIPGQIKFTITNNEGTYSLNVLEGTIKNYTITTNDEIPTINIEIENEPIPTYTLNINKIVAGETTPLQGAEFILIKEGEEVGTYTTDANGEISVSGLYAYEADKGLNQTYTLREKKAPAGYAKIKDIVFTVTHLDGEYSVDVTTGKLAGVDVTGDTVSFTIEDNPTFTLKKVDRDTQEPLAGVKFVIIDEETGEFAKNGKGEYVGEKVEKYGQITYVVTTDANGEIKLDLTDGLYRAVEIECGENYIFDTVESRTNFFGIGMSREESSAAIVQEDIYESIYPYYQQDEKYLSDTETAAFLQAGNPMYSGNDYINHVAESVDGGYFAVGQITMDGSYEVGNYEDYDSIPSIEVVLPNGEIATAKDQSMAFTVKYNEVGGIEWFKSVDGDYHVEISDVKGTPDGGCLVVGTFEDEVITFENRIEIYKMSSWETAMVLKYDANGNVEWAKSFGSGDYNRIESIDITEDGGFVVVGCTGNPTFYPDYTNKLESEFYDDAVIVKYDANGNYKWGHILGGAGLERFNTVKATADGGVIAVGGFESSEVILDENHTVYRDEETSSDAWIMKFAEDGSIEWVNTLADMNATFAVAETMDGNFLVGFDMIADITILPDGTELVRESEWSDILLIRYDQDGNFINYRTIKHTSSNYIKDINVYEDNSYTLALDCAGYAVIEKYDENDQFIWDIVKYDERYDDCASITNVVKLNNGEYVAGGTYRETWGIHYAKRFYGPFDGVIWRIRTDGIAEDSEISVGNAKKRYYIMTAVDGYYGGYITGQEYIPWEIVEHGESNKLQITMYPYDGYEIKKITINGEEQQFEANEDGTYTLPTITNITEHKYIVVYFINSTEKVVINKIDETTGEGLPGAEFYIEQLEERNEPGDILGDLTDNSTTYTVGDLDNEITDTALGDLTGSSSNYYTVDYDNEVTDALGILTDNGQEYVYTDESINESDQIGSLTDNGTEISVVNTENDVTESVLGSLTNNGTYYFVAENTTYVPTNSGVYQIANGATGGVANSTANSYLEIDLTNYTGTYRAVVNFDMKGSDYGYATITNSTTAPAYSSSTGRFIIANGTFTGREYVSKELTGGNIYYLHLGYRKDSTVDTTDKGIIFNSIKVYGTTLEEYNFIENENGGYESTNQGKEYTTSRSYIPIDLTNYEGKYRLRLNITMNNSGSGDVGFAHITTDTNPIEYSNSSGRIMYLTGDYTGYNIETLIEGGQVYYLHLGYYKDAGYNVGTDKLVVNNIQLFGTYSEYYHFVENANGGYESTNQGKHNIVSNSYIPIDLTNYTGTYTVVVNAESSSESNYDWGYVTVNQSTNRPLYNLATGRFIYLSGTVGAKDYFYNLNGGSIYYLHMGYRKDGSQNTGNDKFTVNSVNLYQSKEVTYNFIEETDGVYKSTNQGNLGTLSSSYIPIDLTNYTGEYILSLDAGSSGQSGDYSYVTVTDSTTVPAYNSGTGRFVYTNGTSSKTNYTYTLTGGSVYYLHLGFYKKAYMSGNAGTDTFTVENIRLCLKAEKTFNFAEVDGKYVSTNQGYANTTSASYIPLDLTNYEGKYELIVNAEIDSQENGDYGYVFATTTTTQPSYNTSAYRAFRISGAQEAKDYTYTLVGGNLYYIHLGYYKNAALNTGTDTFTINSIQLKLSDADLYRGYATTGMNGQAFAELPYGIYKITEVTAPEGYVLNEASTEIEFREDTGNEFTITNARDGRVVVHHYYKDTTEKVAEDEIIDGHIGEEYTTLPMSSTAEYELEKDDNGEYILPDNASGTFVSGDTEVIYYYVRNNIPLTVNHYIDGTNLEVPLKDGTTKATEVGTGVEGEEYTTTEVTADELNEKYKLVETPANATGFYEYEDVIVTYYYDVKTFDVTTDVNGEGGTISGQGKSSYENVEYGEDSQKEIVATPADLYKVSSITVNDEEIEFTENVDRTVTLNQFTSMTEDKNVVVTFEAIQGEVTVHHYEAIANDDGTYTYTQNKVVEDEIKTGNIGDIFATKESELIPEYYEFLEAVEPTSGEYAETPIEVVYYYTYKNYDYTVEYYYEGVKDDTKTEVKQDIYLNQVTDYEDKVIDGYKFDKVEGIPLEISTIPENNIIKVYYVKDSFEYSVEYYYEGVKDDSKTVTNTAIFEEEIVDYEDKVIDGYKFDHTENNPLKITSDSTANVMKVYYVKDSFGYSVEYYYEGVKDDSKTVTNTAIFEEEIVDYEDKVIDGYKFDHTENNPLKITSDSTANVMKIYYVKDSFEYTVEYYYQGVKDDSKTVTNTAIFEEEIVDYEDKVIDGYKFDHTENNPLKITSDSTANVMKVYYVKDSFGYSIEYYYEGVKDDSKTVTGTAVFEEEITYFEQKPIDGYKFDHTENNPLKITSDSTANVMKVYYVKDRFAYTVEYYYDGVKDDSKTDTNIATFETEITNYTDKVIDGYKFDNVENLPLKITSNETTNVIRVYYIRNVFGYSVEYYYNGVKDEEATEVFNATFADVIDTYTDKVKTGYKFEKTNNYPLTVTSDETANVIKVFYVADENQTKEISYTVEYYKDGIFVENEIFVENIQILENEILTVDKGAINVTDKYFGYKFVNTNPSVIPDTIENKGIIKVYYEIDEAQTKELSYTVEYYKDGTLADTEVEKTTVQVLQPDTMTVAKDKINVADKYDGYKFVNTDPETIPDTVTTGEVIKVYYEKDTFEYTVEYYFDNVKDEAKTETNTAIFEEVIDTYTDKVEVGYKLSEVVGTPLTITSNPANNTIKVYYVTDEAQTKELSYTVEYYKDGVIADTEVEKTTVQVLQPDTMSVVKDNINTADKYYGYIFVNTDPETIPDEIANGGVIKVYYELDTANVKELKYTVEYYKDGVFEESDVTTKVVQILEADTIEVNKDEINTNDKYFGYKFVNTDPETIPDVVDTDTVIKVYYEIDEAQTKELSYTVEYYKDGTLADTEVEKTTVQVLQPDTMSVVKDNINTADKYDGYKFVETNPEEIPDTVTTGEVIKVYYEKDTFEYTVEYYFDNVKDDAKTETNTALFEEVIDTYTDKVEVGYKLSEVVGMPLTITSNPANNIIKVYYVTDEAQTKEISYTVEYYKDGILADSQKFTNVIQILEEEILVVNKDEINTTDKYFGYKFINTDPETIPDEIANGGVIKVYYEIDEENTKELTYTVEYYKDGVKSDEDVVTKVVQILEDDTLEVDKTAINTTDKYDGYEFVGTDPEEIPDTVTTGTVIKVNYEKDTFEYTVEYYFDDVKDEAKTEINTAAFEEVIDTYTDKVEVGYKLSEVVGMPLTITSNPANNIIKVYYVTDEAQTKELSYTVEYYKDGVIADTEVETTTVQVLQPDTMSVVKDNINTADKYDGYKFVETNPEEIPDTVTKGEVIKVYYEKDTFEYTVEYYFDDVKDEAKTETNTAIFEEVIDTYTDKVEVGYKLSEVVGTPLTITSNPVNNIIKVYYVTDEAQTKELSYTVEYYKDGVIADTEVETTIVQILQPDTMTVAKDKINVTDKYFGYEFVNTDPAEIPDTVTTGDVIKVYYEIDEENTKELTYTVEYYKDGVLTDTEVETKIVQILEPDTMPVVKENINVVDKYDGYEFVGTDPEEIPDTVTTGTVIKVNYEKDTFEYTVEYYFDNVKDEAKTEINTAAFEEVIDTYTDKVEVGYKFDKVEGTPLTITSNPANNIIKVYYVTDEAQTKELSYTVEYYKNGTLADTEVETTTVQVLQPDTMTVEKDKINVTDKYVGYKFENTDPAEIPDTVNNGDVIKVYYVKDSFEYTVEYYYEGIKDEENTVSSEALYGDTIDTYTEKVKEGYKLEKTENLPLVVSENTEENVIKVYYVIDDENTKQLSYTVEYYKDGELAETENVTEVVQILEDDILEVDKDSINTTDKYVGYEFVETDPAEIPDTINNGETIKVYYVKGEFEYRVEYYYENVIDDTKTETLAANYGDVIENVENKVIDGYAFEKAENFPLEVSENAEENVIKIYYKIDDAQTKEISYTVEYYKDGVLDEESTQVVTKTVQVLQPEVLDVNKEDINLVDKYDGYKLDAENTEEVPNIVNDGEVIKVYYIRKDAEVVVKYYEQDSENALADEETIRGKVFDEYSTEAKEIEGYTLVDNTDNTEGKMTEEPIEVIYYYAKNVNVTVKHIDKNTGEILDEEVIPAKDGDIVETLPKDIPEYVLVESPEDTTVQVEKEDIEVIYIYVKVSAGVVEKHIDVKSGEVLASNVYEGNEGDPYTTAPKEFEGYDLVVDMYPENAEGVMAEEVIEVKYYYIRKVKVTIKYVDTITGEEIVVIDEETGEEEETTVVIEGHEGDTVTPEIKELDGYEIVEIPVNEEIVLEVESSVDEEGNIVIETEIIVEYKYAREADVVVEHIDITTGEKLLEDEYIEGYEGKEYTTESKEIARYVLVEEPANKEGIMKVEEVVDEETGETTINKTTVVTYKYDKKPATIIIRYVNKLTSEIFEEEVVEGKLDAPYTTEPKEFEGYRFLEEEYPENATGVFIEEQIVINYYYMKISKILVYYVDSVTGELVSSEIEMDGYEGEEYVTTPIEIPGYVLVEERYPENASGKYEEEREVVYYYYVRETTVEVTYIDKETGEELAEKEVIEGKEGDKYTTEEKEIPYYKLDEVENPEGEMKATVTVDEETGEETVNTVTEVVYKYVKQEFDMRVDKTITEVLVNGENRSVRNNKLVKVEIHRKKISTAEVTIRYQIKVTNDGEIAGTAIVSERIPDNMYFYPGENPAWTQKGELAYLETEELKPGESATYEVVLHWDGSEEIGTYTNNVEIVSTENDAEYEDCDSKDDKSEASIIIVTATGIELLIEKAEMMKIGNVVMLMAYAIIIIKIVKKTKK